MAGVLVMNRWQLVSSSELMLLAADLDLKTDVGDVKCKVRRGRGSSMLFGHGFVGVDDWREKSPEFLKLIR